MSECYWWCMFCKCVVEPQDVTYDESHDPRANGCGHGVVSVSKHEAAPDKELITDLWGRNRDLLTRAEKAESELAALRESVRWVLCSERLPVEYGIYDVVVVWAPKNLRRRGCEYFDPNNGWMLPTYKSIEQWRVIQPFPPSPQSQDPA